MCLSKIRVNKAVVMVAAGLFRRTFPTQHYSFQAILKASLHLRYHAPQANGLYQPLSHPTTCKQRYRDLLTTFTQRSIVVTRELQCVAWAQVLFERKHGHERVFRKMCPLCKTIFSVDYIPQHHMDVCVG